MKNINKYYKDEIKKIIENLRNKAYFSKMEDFPEDFIKTRVDWEELACNYKALYYALMEIEENIED